MINYWDFGAYIFLRSWVFHRFFQTSSPLPRPNMTSPRQALVIAITNLVYGLQVKARGNVCVMGKMHLVFAFCEVQRERHFLDRQDNKIMSVSVSINGGIFWNLFCEGMERSDRLWNDTALNKLSIKSLPFLHQSNKSHGVFPQNIVFRALQVLSWVEGQSFFSQMPCVLSIMFLPKIKLKCFL